MAPTSMAAREPAAGAAAAAATPVPRDYELAVDVSHLTFRYGEARTGKPVLDDVSLQLLPGTRCIVSGDNGAGKTTLLRVLGGRHSWRAPGDVRVLGRKADFDTSLNLRRKFLEAQWATHTVSFAAYSVPLQADIAVKDLSPKLQEEFSDRRDLLMRVLDIDPEWRMHRVSDGQRRRVQLLLGLLRPVDILLLDEITVDLDLVTRQDLLSFLKSECETRGMTIVYATHIFDGLEDWATDIVYMTHGRVTRNTKLSECEELVALRTAGVGSPLMRVVERWIRADRKRVLEDAGGDVEGARRQREPLPVRKMNTDGHAGGFTAGRMINHWG